jgi:putative tricarboxylic transport membrane protein
VGQAAEDSAQLYAGILIFATVGAYGMRQSAFDLFLLYGIGVLGVIMRRFDFPTAPWWWA